MFVGINNLHRSYTNVYKARFNHSAPDALGYMYIYPMTS